MKIEQWLVSIFAIFGAFILCGFGGLLISNLINTWEVPTTGFFAAFGVISIAYLSAPANKIKYVLAWYIGGAFLSLFVITQLIFPTTKGESIYSIYGIPFIATLGGGGLALLICMWPLRPWPPKE